MKKVVLKERKCKNCGEKFMQVRPLQYLCGGDCGWQYADKKAKEKDKKDIKNLKIEVYGKEYRNTLQNEINKLSRMIDAKFGFVTCIDCNKPFGKQIDAAHFHSRGSNSTLRYNLHNLHSAKSDCNQYSEKHKSGYKLGLIDRYGKGYYDYVENDLPLYYKEIKLTNKEVYEKLAIVRKLIRDFNTFQFTDSINARNLFNEIIGIYK